MPSPALSVGGASASAQVIPPTCYQTRVSRAAQLAQLKQQPYHEYISKTRPPKARPPYKSDSSERVREDVDAKDAK